jgi:hypothetical protein
MNSDVTGPVISTNKYKIRSTNKIDQICDQPNKFQGCSQVVGDTEFFS